MLIKILCPVDECDMHL